MSDAPSEERLNDYVDGLLSAQEAREVERALAASAEAQATVEFLRSLRARTEQLPAAIEPGRDLWPEIAGRMVPAPLASVGTDPERATRIVSNEAAPDRAWWPSLGGFQWATLAAAAMLLMVVSSALTAWMLAMPGSANVAGPSAVAVPTAGSEREEIRPTEAAYALEIEQLMRVLYENRDTLDPDTVSTIETNLRVIDRAIDRVREALEEEPANPGLARMLTSNYRHKVQLLQRANRIIKAS